MHDALLRVTTRSPLVRYKTGALIVRDDEIISSGWSHVGIDLNETFSIHAELHALWRARHVDLTGATCYTLTFRPQTNRVLPAKPCAACAKSLRAAGINSVVTLDEIYDLNETNDFKRYKRPDGIYP